MLYLLTRNRRYILILFTFFAPFIGATYASPLKIKAFFAQDLPQDEQGILIDASASGSLEPFIYRGAAKNWPQSSLTPDYFALTYGDSPLIERHIYTNTSTTYARHRESLRIPCQNLDDCDERAYDLTDLLDSEVSAVSDSLFPPNPSTELYIGPENTPTPLHFHGSAYIAQLYGVQTVSFIPPQYKEKLENIPFSPDDCATHSLPICTWEDLDLHNPSVLAKIEAAGIPIYQDTLYPGDVLYIPDQWLHDVKANGESVSIAYGF